jgi:predicted PurR-regulated permease PerM
MGRQLEIHPLAAIFAVLVGAEIGGIVGIYLAIPLMAAMRVIWRLTAFPRSEAEQANAVVGLAPLQTSHPASQQL